MQIVVPLLSQHPSGINANVASKIFQVRIKECKTRFFFCSVNPYLLSSLRHFNCDTTFAVNLPLLVERVLGLNRIRNRCVKPRPQIVKIWQLWMFLTSQAFWYIDWYDFFEVAASYWPSRFCWSGEKFVKDLSVLSGKRRVDELENNFLVSFFLDKRVGSTVFDKFCHG